MACAHSKDSDQPGSEVIKHFSCSTQLSMNFFLLINVNMLTKNCWHFNISEKSEKEKSILGLSEPEKMLNFLIFLYILAFQISCPAELSMKTVL